MSARLLHIRDWEGLARQAEFQPITIAALCQVSLRQLERFFGQYFNKTPGEWVRELRFRLAREHITQGYSTKAVAAELKFASESHFCHEFKKAHGVSPQSFAPTYCARGMSRLSNDVAFKQSIAID